MRLGLAQKVRNPTDGPQQLENGCGRRVGPLWLYRCKDIRTPVRKVTGATDRSMRVASDLKLFRYQSDMKKISIALAFYLREIYSPLTYLGK